MPVAASPPIVRATTRRSLYAVLGPVVAAVILLGFTPTYWGPIVFGPASVRPLVHLHAALFFGWAVLYAVQAALVATARVSLHRRVGVLGATWSLVAVLVGVRLAASTIARDLEVIDGTFGAVITLIPLTQVSMFACFIGLGIASVRQSAVHKRFMTLAALIAVTPALARIGIWILGADSALLPAFAFVTSTGLLLGVVAYDARRAGRLHPVFLWGGAAIVLVRLIRVPLAMSPAWRSTAEAIAALVS